MGVQMYEENGSQRANMELSGLATLTTIRP